MRVYKGESCRLCLLLCLSERWVEPDDIALPIPAWNRCVSCSMYSSLWLSCCDLVRYDMLVLRPQMFSCQMKVLKMLLVQNEPIAPEKHHLNRHYNIFRSRSLIIFSFLCVISDLVQTPILASKCTSISSSRNKGVSLLE